MLILDYINQLGYRLYYYFLRVSCEGKTGEEQYHDHEYNINKAHYGLLLDVFVDIEASIDDELLTAREICVADLRV